MKLRTISTTVLAITASLTTPISTFAQVIGGVNPPTGLKYVNAGTQGQGLFLFISNVFKLVGTIAGIYMIFQLINAGYGYINASGDPKKTELAWAQIWQSLMGMVIIASAFVIASLITRFTGIEILNPTIYGPN